MIISLLTTTFLLANAAPGSVPSDLILSRAAPPVSQSQQCRLNPDICTKCDLKNADITKYREFIWEDTGLGVGKFLDDWVKKNGEKQWFSRMDKAFAGAEVAPENYCDTLGGGKCDSPQRCSSFKDTRMYWIRMAAKAHYEVLQYLSTWMVTKTVTEMLHIPQLLNAFRPGRKGDVSPIPSLISGIFVVLAALASGNALLGGIFTGILGVINLGVSGTAQHRLTGEPTDQEVEDAVKGALESTFESGIDSLESLGRLAMKGFDPSNSKLSTKDLPNLKGSGRSTNVGKYFDKGRFLVMDIDSEMSPLKEKWGLNLRRSMAVQTLRQFGYFIYINTAIKSEKDCLAEGKRFWIQGGCADLWMRNQRNDYLTADGQQEAIIDKMMDPNIGALDVGLMYNNAIDCARKHPDSSGQVDMKNKDITAHTPECLYNIGVFKGFSHWVSNLDRWLLCPEKDVDWDVNTTGTKYSKCACSNVGKNYLSKSKNCY